VDPDASDVPTCAKAVDPRFQYPREVDFRSDVEDLEQLRLEADAGWSDTQRLFENACDDETERTRV
jgi:hypothetical protein